MNIKDITYKINNHINLTKQEIDFIVQNYTNNHISDEDMTDFIQSIYTNNLSDQELYWLTIAMKNSGEVLDLSDIGQVVDKHSTGGVSDTTTIIIAPICATLGTKMLKLSGRGLGFTGGTADKLESFKGYKTELPIEKAKELVKQNGACMITSTKNLAPADKKIYALRNKTGLVDSIPLIASSIMSKKLASGGDIIVLDVKYGNGAFMPNKHKAKQLAKKMKIIGKKDGKKVKIVLGKMNQPLGYNIGPQLEAMEAIEVLKGAKNNLQKASVKLASICVALDKHIPYFFAKLKVKKTIKNNSALTKLKTMISCQGGSLDLFNLSYPTPTLNVKSKISGKVTGFDTKKLGQIVAQMGTVKINNTDEIHYEYGVRTFHKIGNKVKKGDIIFSIYAKDQTEATKIQNSLLSCITIK